MPIGGGIKFVFLAVVEIRHWESRMLLSHRRHGECAGSSIGLKGTEVVFKASHKRDVLHALFVAGDFEHAPNDAGVRLDIFLLGHPPNPDRQTNVRRLEAMERVAKRFIVQRVRMNMLHAVNEAVAVAREPENRGSGFQERLRYAPARDPRSSNDQRPDLHDGFSLFSSHSL
jgi:hypothetical protein